MRRPLGPVGRVPSLGIGWLGEEEGKQWGGGSFWEPLTDLDFGRVSEFRGSWGLASSGVRGWGCFGSGSSAGLVEPLGLWVPAFSGRRSGWGFGFCLGFGLWCSDHLSSMWGSCSFICPVPSGIVAYFAKEGLQGV